MGGLQIFCARMAELHPHIQFIFCNEQDPACVVREATPGNASFATISDQASFRFSSISAIWKLLKKTQPDLVIYTLSGAIRPLPWLAKLVGARVVYMDSTSRTQFFRTKGLKGAVQRFMVKPLSLVIAASEYTRQAGISENLFFCSSVTIPNGTDPGRAHVSGKDFRLKWGVPESARLVTQCSWLVPEKGVDIFIGAARKLAGPDTWFLVAGDGSHSEEYQKMSEGLNVIFTGGLDDPLADGLYAATDIFCLPSRWQEACGLVNLEAMSCGVPVIASRRGGIPEFVADGVAGLLVEPTVEDLTEKLSLLLDDEALRLSLGAGARQRAHDLFTLDKMVEGYSRALEL
jgi:glycosyltransferase involved in cell wall biosynthesis